MHILQSAAPHPRLAPYVHCFVHREIFPGSPDIIQPWIAALEPILTFEIGSPTIVTFSSGKTAAWHRAQLIGAQTRYTGSRCLGKGVAFAIFFRPFATWQLFRVPPAELTDLVFPAAEVLGSWVTELLHVLADSRTFAGQAAVTTKALLPFVTAADPLTSIMSTMHRLLPTTEPARITEVARSVSISVRTYERQFEREIGIPPRKFARLARFARAIDRKRTDEDSWLDIAHRLGYFDQMHMIKDFRTFGGDTPGRLLRADSDFQPWSIKTAFQLEAEPLLLEKSN